jgi:hypothetical protein
MYVFSDGVLVKGTFNHSSHIKKMGQTRSHHTHWRLYGFVFVFSSFQLSGRQIHKCGFGINVETYHRGTAKMFLRVTSCNLCK